MKECIMPDRPEGYPVPAPLSGKIVSVNVLQGQLIYQGDVICVLEAMKMDNQISSTLSGTVTYVHVCPEETVSQGAPLITVNPVVN